MSPTKSEIETLNVCGKAAVANAQVPVAKTDAPVAKMVEEPKQAEKKAAAKGGLASTGDNAVAPIAAVATMVAAAAAGAFGLRRRNM